MIEPWKLIGLEYRLGADPERHGAADCLSMSRAVLHWGGIPTPEPERSWYRRLRRGDYEVFRDELERWGHQTDTAKLGVVGLGRGSDCLGLIAFYESGWLHFNDEKQIAWVPLNALTPVALYSRLKSKSVKPSA